MRQLVIAAVIREGDRFLICQRPPGKRYGGLWEFPGGKVEPGESMEAAARRELREELGVELESLGSELLAVDDPGSRFTICFHVTSIRGTPEPLEHRAVAWVPLPALSSYSLAPSDLALVRHLAAVGR